MSAFETTLVRAWYRGAGWLWLLRPLELVFRGLAAMRRWYWQRGPGKPWRAPVPVVVVGNITVGGTGKTPVVIALIEALQARGLRPGVVSRGYGADPDASFPHRVGDDSDSRQCGDEPLLIYRRTGAPCVVDPDRPAAIRALLAEAVVDLVICDDGLQHYALHRDLEIVVVDAVRGLGNRWCLPAGPLREPPARLRRVQWVLYRGSDRAADGVRYVVDGLFPVQPGTAVPPPGPQPVYAVAGIGQPEQFFDSLRVQGYTVRPRVFPDHHAFTVADLAPLDDAPVIMTEKDAVKCRTFALPGQWYLRISATLPAELPDMVAALRVTSSSPPERA